MALGAVLEVVAGFAELVGVRRSQWEHHLGGWMLVVTFTIRARARVWAEMEVGCWRVRGSGGA